MLTNLCSMFSLFLSHNHVLSHLHFTIMTNLLTVSSTHWGRGGLETNENILSTLQALVESTCHLPADNRLGTFQMFLHVPGRTHDVGAFMEHLECTQSVIGR